MIYSKVSTSDKGGEEFKKFLATISKASTAYVTIGLHEDAGQYTEGKSPPSVVEVGLWNEFGTKSSPERSWLRSAIDQHEEQIAKWRDEAVENILHKDWDLEKALEMMGFRIQALIQNQIISNVPPPNAPSTVEAKAAHGVGPSTLIDSGLMYRSVTFRVVIA